MSGYAVIHGEHTGDWAVIASGERLELYRPTSWHDHRPPNGLSYYPMDGIGLPRAPWLAWWVARRLVAKHERAARRTAARRARTHAFITARSKEPR